MNVVSYQFFHSVRWGAIESILYQLLFVGHHAALFTWCTPTTYGTVGILFSALYTTTTLCNLGMDLLLAPQIKSWALSQSGVSSFFMQHVSPSLIAIMGCIGITGYCWGHSSPTLWLVLAAALLIESFRKTLRTLLRLVNYNRPVALVEICTFLSYMAITWGWYWSTGSFTLISIFLPLVIAGSLSFLVLLLCAAHWYATLPATSSYQTQIPTMSTRTPLITHQVTSTLLSPNIIVLLCSLRLEVTQIGSVKLISTVVHSLALILNKTFGTATAVLYAAHQLVPLRNNRPPMLIASTFSLPFTLLFSAMTLGSCCAYLGGASIGINLLLTLTISVITSYLATYEQLFISNSSTTSLLIPNLATLVSMIILSQIPYAFSATVIMATFLALRIATAIMLSNLAAQRWSISPLLHTQTLIITGSLVSMALLVKLFIW